METFNALQSQMLQEPLVDYKTEINNTEITIII
jgi:hypothetical protein